MVLSCMGFANSWSGSKTEGKEREREGCFWLFFVFYVDFVGGHFFPFLFFFFLPLSLSTGFMVCSWTGRGRTADIDLILTNPQYSSGSVCLLESVQLVRYTCVVYSASSVYEERQKEHECIYILGVCTYACMESVQQNTKRRGNQDGGWIQVGGFVFLRIDMRIWQRG